MSDFSIKVEEYLPAPEITSVAKNYTVVGNPKNYTKALDTVPEDCLIFCRTISGDQSLNTKCVGFCWSKLHRGFLTKKQMIQHQCLEKNCKSFYKLQDAPYWIQKEATAQKRKQGKRLKKQIAEDEARFLEEIRDLTIHDFNFYPVAVDFKNDTYETRIITFGQVNYSHYLSLFTEAAEGKKIHFTNIKANNDRKKRIIETNNIVKISAPPKSKSVIFIDFIKAKISAIFKYIQDKLFTR